MLHNFHLKESSVKTRSVLRRDSNDRIKTFNRDEWLLQRQLERTRKLLNLDPDFKKTKENIACDDTRSKIENKNDLSDINGSLSTRRSLSRYDKGNSNESDSSNCDTPKTVGATPSSRMDRTERVDATKVNIDIIPMMVSNFFTLQSLCTP